MKTKTKLLTSIILALGCYLNTATAKTEILSEGQLLSTNQSAIKAMEKAGFLTGVSNAGTPGLTGTYLGKYRLYAWLSGEGLMAEGINKQAWFWDFDAKKVTFSPGTIQAKQFPWPKFKYETHQPIDFVDNHDGTYTVDYGFQVHHWLFGNPQGRTTTTFKITKDGTNYHFEVLDIEVDGSSDGTIGTKFSGIFPKEVQLEWRGQ